MDDLFVEGLVSADLPADQALAQAGRIAQVLAAMEKLPSREREALLLSAMDELSTAAIGAVLGRSEASVRSLIFRARAHLRQRLQD
jgi:RNA polymerase sigma-70 factor (ECF subfamily)